MPNRIERQILRDEQISEILRIVLNKKTREGSYDIKQQKDRHQI